MEDNAEVINNPLDINGPNFDCEAYLSQLLKQKSLQKLLDTEHSMVQEVRRLDSDMQTLVYENYNKFITATDTIRKMKTDFVKMEDQMDQLAQKMTRITEFSENVSHALSGQRENIQSLARANRTLKNLEFIFELPQTLQSYVDKKEYSLAVKSYLRAKAILHQYKDEPSFKGIYSECEVIVEELRDQLKEQFKSRNASTKEVTTAVNQLLTLGDPSENLADEFLESAECHLSQELGELRDQVSLKRGVPNIAEEKVSRPADAIPNLPMDVLEFVDTGCSSFLGNLSLVVQTFTDMFLLQHRESTSGECSKARSTSDSKSTIETLSKTLVQFINRLMTVCFELAEQRFMLECDPSESSIVVRALDRFYRRLQATSKLLPDINYAESSLAILLRVAEHEVEMSYRYMEKNLDIQVKETRQQLAASHKTLLAPVTPGRSEQQQLLADLLSKLEQNTIHNLKTALANLLQFTAYDVTFASKSRFLLTFGRMVREDLVVKFFNRLIQTGSDFCEGRGDKAYVNATLILLLSRFAKNLETSTAGYILDLCEQQFRLAAVGGEDERRKVKNLLTPADVVTGHLGKVSQKLLDHYVEMEGFALSQLLVKSVETRDWLGCVEPRAVRAVMKRVVEDLTAIDTRVGQLFEEGSRKDRSSDSSRRTTGMSLASRAGRPSVAPLGDTALSSTLGKLWTERIDYFSSVEFTKVSVLTGIVKICLKTLLESVRLRTFGRYGLQQVQVDSHYLQLYLWRFVSDEHLIHCLLDEVVSSAVHRCTQPQLMEPSVVEVICDRG